ncbi:MAG: KdsC family phosphatase [Rubripirellula sp.]
MSPSLKSDLESSASIRCILSDVDGVMTNGAITYGRSGEEMKSFHVRDGLGIKLWMRSGFSFSIITARESEVVQRRAAELGILEVHQGSADKHQAASEIVASIGCDWSEVCYVGDDLPDLPVMNQVGLAVAPADAAKDVCDAAHWILKSKGGEGALRECIERLLRAKGRWAEHLPSRKV